jgi:hypothetical protein
LVWTWQCDKINAGQSLNKYTVVVLLHQATENCLNKTGVIENGFGRAGLVPWNKDALDTTKLLPGTIFADSSSCSDQDQDFQTNSGVMVSSGGFTSSLSPGASQVQSASVGSSDHGQDGLLLTNTPVRLVGSPDLGFSHPTTSQIELEHNLSGVIEFTQDASSSSTGIDELLSVGNSIDFSDNSGGLDSTNSQDQQEVPTQDVGSTSMKCPQCSRGIPLRVFDIHKSMCSSTPGFGIIIPTTQSVTNNDSSSTPGSGIVIPTTQSVTNNDSSSTPWSGIIVPTTQNVTNNGLPKDPIPEIKTVPDFSLKDRGRQLQKFEMLLLSEETIDEFNQLFSERNLDAQEPLFQSWLILKNASLPTEDQALKKVLQDHTASNVSKKKTNRKRNLPLGPARYDPVSPEWEAILHEQAAKKPKAKNNPKQPQPKQKKPPAKQKGDKTSKRKLRL